MDKAKIDRINVLARKQKTEEGLNADEKAEQAALRAEYLAEMRASLLSTLDNTVIQYPDGSKKPINDFKK